MIKSATWKLGRNFLFTHFVLAIAFFAFLPAVLGLVNIFSGNFGTTTATPTSQTTQQVQEDTQQNQIQPSDNQSDTTATALAAAEPTLSTTAELVVGIIAAVLYLIIMAASAQGSGFADRSPVYYNGFVAGAIASIPAIIFTVMLSITAGDVTWIRVLHRIWMSPYIELYSVYGNSAILLAYLTLPLMPIATGLGYIRGIKKKASVTAKLNATAPKTE